ncbi:hypothetical protein ABPG75_009314 [Micractinium tetrahymenae]
MGALALQACQLGAGNALRSAPHRRPRNTARSAAAVAPTCLSPEQMASALQHQLAKSAEAAAAEAQRRAARPAVPAEEPSSEIPLRKPSRRALRAGAEARAAAEAAATATSAQIEELQAAVRRQAGALGRAALAAALAVQLRQSGTMDEDEFAEAWADLEDAAPPDSGSAPASDDAAAPTAAALPANSAVPAPSMAQQAAGSAQPA